MRRIAQPSQKDGIDATAKPNAAIDFDDGHTVIKPRYELRIVIDVDQLRLNPVAAKQCERFVTQVASLASV